MSKKYIGQIDNDSFVFPNNRVAEYDVEIIHDINDNCVSGQVIAFSATTVSSTGMTVSFDYIWDLNGATPYERNSGAVSVLSLHMMGPTQNYYKPFLCVGRFVFNNIPITRIESGVTPGFSRLSFVLTPSMIGVPSFTNGTYYFEVKFIGERCVFPVCFSQQISAIPTPTPTPTPTATSTPTPTPTSTPTPTPTVSVCCVSGGTLNVTDTGYIRWTLCNGDDVDTFLSSTGTYTITSCIQDGSIRSAFPLADLAAWTVLTTGTTCGGICGPTPTPTATPTSTPTPTPTSTPTATPSNPCYCFPIVVTGSTLPPPEGGTIATLQYNDCDGVLTARAFSVGPGTYYQCIQVISSVVQYDPIGTTGIDQSYLTLTYLTGNCNTGYDCSGYVPSGSTPTPTPTSTPTSTPTPTPTSTPVGPTATPTPTPTPTIAPEVYSFTGCGYGNSVANACNDAGINNRTLYSDCTTGTFGIGCFVYTDTFPNALTGWEVVFMNGANWDLNTSTGQVTALSSTQC